MRKKGQFSTILLFIVFLAGLSLLLYPTLSDYINSMHQTVAIAAYSEQVAAIDKEDYAAYWQAAMDFNRGIQDRRNQFVLSDEESTRYYDLLNLSGTGIMGYIEIPAIEIALPVYHGTSDDVLQVAVGHLDWTSLPVGGKSTHCVLSGHRGLPSAKLFTHLDQLVVGDVFVLRVLDEVMTYEVDQVLIVKPDETDALKIENGKDYCTLVTCTPYGINTHRLLVRGHRIENAEESLTVHITSEAIQIEPMLVSSVVGIPLLMLSMAVASAASSGRRKRTAESRRKRR